MRRQWLVGIVSLVALVAVLALVIALVGGGDDADDTATVDSSSRDEPSDDSRPGDDDEGPQVGDHIHAAYGVYICDRYLGALSDLSDPLGIHTHADGVVHVHPFSAAASGRRATVRVFAQAVGLGLSDDEIRLPDGQRYREEDDDCGGQEGTVQVLRWSEGHDEPVEVVTSDVDDVRFLKDREAFAIAFSPQGADIPKPPSVANLDTLTDVPSAASSTSVPAGSAAAAGCPSEGASDRRQTFPSPPPMCIDVAKIYTATIDTSKGAFTVELLDDRSPKTVNNFVFLSRHRYYEGINFHRIIPGFVVQAGDPRGDGSGGPGYEFEDELPSAGEYQIGSMAMANKGPDTNGSQFFVITGENGTRLPPSYALFGRVIEGMDVVKAIEAAGTDSGTPQEQVTIRSVTIRES